MICALILAATITATPPPATATAVAAVSPTASKTAVLISAPARASQAAGPRTLADVGAERKLNGRSSARGSFSASGSTVVAAPVPVTDADWWRARFGEPERINLTIDANGNRHEQWVMKTGSYVYFVNGKSAGYQNTTKP
jgi:hypothetical protein